MNNLGDIGEYAKAYIQKNPAALCLLELLRDETTLICYHHKTSSDVTEGDLHAVDKSSAEVILLAQGKDAHEKKEILKTLSQLCVVRSFYIQSCGNNIFTYFLPGSINPNIGGGLEEYISGMISRLES